jgi:transposase-like protein
MRFDIEEMIMELRSAGESYEEIARKLQINEAELLVWTRWRQELVRQERGCCG